MQRNRCGLMYASPRAKAPDHVQIQTWDPDQISLSWVTQRLEKERLQVRDYARTRALLNRVYPRRGKLLEIGSGLGFLLAEFKKDGWDTLGVEPDRFMCRYAKEELGVESLSTILENADIDNKSYDVILMNHVIEHVGDPRSIASMNPLARWFLESREAVYFIVIGLARGAPLGTASGCEPAPRGPGRTMGYGNDSRQNGPLSSQLLHKSHVGQGPRVRRIRTDEFAPSARQAPRTR
jgi:SAM-dependent methyltransferase